MKGGLKRKIPIAKIEKEDSRRVTFSKRSHGLYSKASELCLLFDSKIAIITTPPSSNSNASFYSFGHSSVDSVVDAFLADQRPPPPKDLGLGLWWEDEGLAKSEDPEEVRNALDAMKKMLHDLRMTVDKRGDREEDVKEKTKKKKNKKLGLHGTHQKQTLNLQPSSSSASVDENLDAFNKKIEEQALAICDKSGNDEPGILDGFGDELECLLMNVDEMDETNQNQFSDYPEALKGGELHRDFYENNLHFDDDQSLAISDNNKNDVFLEILREYSQDLDFDEMMNLEKMDGGSVEDRRFTETFSELTPSIAAL